MTPSAFDALIQDTANHYGLPFDLLKSQCIHESSLDPMAFRFEPAYYKRYVVGNPNVKTPSQYGPLAACSFGLLQIMLEEACELGYTDRPENLFIPRVGLAFGAKDMQRLLAWANGDYFRALAAYNGGEGGNSTPPYRNAEYATAVYAIAGRTV